MSWPPFIHRLCDLFAELANQRTRRRKPYRVLDEWLVEMERLVRIDGRDPELIERVIRWAHEDGFWSGNVLSVPKLRQQFDTLLLRSGLGGATTALPESAPEGIEPDPAAAAIWEEVLELVSAGQPESAAAHWLAPLTFVGVIDDQVAVVSAPAEVSDWTRKRYGVALTAAMRARCPGIRDLRILAGERSSTEAVAA